MKLIKTSAVAIGVSALLAVQASASIVISIFAGRLDVGNGTASIGAGTLIQLVNLGADGLFDPINIADGTSTGLGQWVSGDDSLVNVAFMVDGAAGDFPTAAAFDLRHSAVAESTTGRLSRVFDFPSSSLTNMKLGIRWFPGIQATDFSTVSLGFGQSYGQFTRQAAPVNGGAAWTVPFADGTITFDSLVTTEAGGPEPVVSGDANLAVIPEPAAIGMSLLGAAGLAMLRRRRA